MQQWDDSSRLLQGERLVSSETVPFSRTDPVPSLADLIDWLTNGGTRMPLASFAFPTLNGFEKGEGLFQAEFGRDALVMSAFADAFMPNLTQSTVRRLAELQGVSDRSLGGRLADGEQVGRILHEMRPPNDPIALEYSRLYGWQWPYFGSVDATPLFVSAAVRAARSSPAFLIETVHQRNGVDSSIAHCVQASLLWLIERLDLHPMGLLESAPASNGCWQVWMDSIDAYHHSDGSLARGSVASVEVQAFVYDALVDAAELADEGLLDVDGQELRRRADVLRRTVLTQLFIEDEEKGDYFGSGMERAGETTRPLRVRSANMGMLLQSRLLEGEQQASYVQAVVDQLFDERGLWCESGIRTLAEDEKRFRPFSYHNGSVWPWQNLWIARGLHRHGRDALARMVEARMLEIADTLGCYPEFVQGSDALEPQPVENILVVSSSDGHNGTFKHTLTQPAQKFQGWTVFGLYALQAQHESFAVA